MSGEYTEELNFGGKLKVKVNGWEIQYYFSGPDLRYNGEFLHIDGKYINEYVKALRENFSEYIKLKEIIPAGGEYEKNAIMGMKIRIGKFSEGVCLKLYHMPIKDKDMPDRVIESYVYASIKAPKIMKMLEDI